MVSIQLIAKEANIAVEDVINKLPSSKIVYHKTK